MLWELRCTRDNFSIEAAAEKGRDLPDWYYEEPELLSGDEFYLRSFYDLHTCRAVGMDLGPIPWNVTVQYAYHHKLEEDLIEPFVLIIRSMDSAYRDWMEGERKKRSK